MESNVFKVRASQAAKDEIDDIYYHYFKVSMEIEVAEKVTQRIWDSIKGLKHMPKRHPLFNNPELRERGVRKLICDNFIVPFTIDEDIKTVFVEHVYHSKMNYEKYMKT